MAVNYHNMKNWHSQKVIKFHTTTAKVTKLTPTCRARLINHEKVKTLIIYNNICFNCNVFAILRFLYIWYKEKKDRPSDESLEWTQSSTLVIYLSYVIWVRAYPIQVERKITWMRKKRKQNDDTFKFASFNLDLICDLNPRSSNLPSAILRHSIGR